jgi:enamine deaminase RidA (YjgF/YER057c/UK114 family)
MGAIEAKLNEIGYSLPPPFIYPKSSRRGGVRVGNMLFLSGHGVSPASFPGVRLTGKLGSDMTAEEGYAAARAVALSMLASLKRALGDLDHVKQVVRLFGMVNSTPEFAQQSLVIDGASDLFFELFGAEAGCHARSAVGMAALPHGMAVEINGEFEIVP